ncbi:NADH dehydrogenase (ubiquinone) 1 alpha subcomplex subunit 5, partial [Lecanoromycetidae sp. Uapishka_2]
MRTTLRLLASVKPGRYLEAGNPTGLTGLFNHPAPRSTLLFLYGSTLDKLKTLPEHSVYRQSTEALTIHRMSIIESIKPEGYDEWSVKAKEKIEAHPDAFKPGNKQTAHSANGQFFVTTDEDMAQDDEKEEWTSLEGSRNPEEKAAETRLLQKGRRIDYTDTIKWEPEPPLDASQISDAETQIGAGLIEEVIQVAEGELKLVDTMIESKVWHDLEEKPQPGQWDYFARDQHTPGTQEPPNK